MSSDSTWENLITVGEVARSHGRWGEVIVNPMTDSTERFRELERVFVRLDEGRIVSLRIEGIREHKGRPILKFQEVSGIGEASGLAGRELRIPESDLVSLPEGRVFHYQVIGCRVRDHALGYLGVVEDVMETGGTDLLVVRGPSGEEHLIPLCSEICRDIDVEEGQIQVDAPEGLVSLNAR